MPPLLDTAAAAATHADGALGPDAVLFLLAGVFGLFGGLCASLSAPGTPWREVLIRSVMGVGGAVLVAGPAVAHYPDLSRGVLAAVCLAAGWVGPAALLSLEWVTKFLPGVGPPATPRGGKNPPPKDPTP